MITIPDLLPAGSVVMLKEGEKRLMVFGVKQTDTVENGESTDFDYIGVLYPEGNMGSEFQFLFNHEDVEEVFFRGYEDAERDEFIERLTEYYELEGQQEEKEQGREE